LSWSGARYTSPVPATKEKPITYAATGVDTQAGDHMVGLIERHVRRTYGPRVLGAHGGFAGCFRLDFNERLFKRNYRDPVLVSCTDGVGTKVKLAAQLKRYDTIGQDLVAMSVNDLIVQGAEPLFFLDYLAVNKLDPSVGEKIVRGVSDGCVQAGCALLGGETAEMPDLYAPGDFDLAGFAVGVCELQRMVTGSRAQAGDVILGLASSGIHSNGYSLVRHIVKAARLDLRKTYPGLETKQTLGELLLAPTRIYARSITALLRRYTVKQVISAMSHITGSGLPGNVPRTLGTHLNARISRKAWDIPPVFQFLQRRGKVSNEEMFKVFNMGVGYVVIVRPHFAESIKHQLEKMDEQVWRLGSITRGTGRVMLG
jgi:phosphoribosylformylglycinamidine cyclo-ligase